MPTSFEKPQPPLSVAGGPPANGGRIPSLDGLRAVAIALVLISHAVNHPGVTLPLIEGTAVGDTVRGISRYGVLIFFVLSGYLITTLLVRERERTGTISLADFWYRRAFRILPVYITYLAVVAVLAATGVLDVGGRAFLAAATYTWNYNFIFKGEIGADYAVIGHLWSLSVEEQFYVAFPLVAWLLRPRVALAVCVLLIILTPFVRLAQYAAFPSVRDYGGIMGHTMFGVSIAMGCVLAYSERLNVGERLRNALSSLPAFALAVLYGFCINPLLDGHFKGKWALPIGESLAGLSAVVLIAYSVRHADRSAAGRLLNWRPVAWLGVISYSVYIWQQLLFSFDVPGISALASRAIVGVASLAVACTSYYALELPMLRLRDRLRRPPPRQSNARNEPAAASATNGLA